MIIIVAVNASPRKGWNTDLLVTAAAEGAAAAGANPYSLGSVPARSARSSLRNRKRRDTLSRFIILPASK